LVVGENTSNDDYEYQNKSQVQLQWTQEMSELDKFTCILISL